MLQCNWNTASNNKAVERFILMIPNAIVIIPSTIITIVQDYVEIKIVKYFWSYYFSSFFIDWQPSLHLIKENVLQFINVIITRRGFCYVVAYCTRLNPTVKINASLEKKKELYQVQILLWVIFLWSNVTLFITVPFTLGSLIKANKKKITESCNFC